MNDEGKKPTEPPVEPPPTEPPKGEPGPVPTSWGDVFQHPRFKELNQRAKDAEEKLAQIEEQAKKENETKLAEQQKWQELAEARQKEIDPLKTENDRLRVAMEKQVPPELMDRIQGKTAEEMREDADKLMQFMKPATRGVPPAGSGRPAAPVDLSKMSPEEIRESKDKLIQ